jgi:hypothetical protein
MLAKHIRYYIQFPLRSCAPTAQSSDSEKLSSSRHRRKFGCTSLTDLLVGLISVAVFLVIMAIVLVILFVLILPKIAPGLPTPDFVFQLPACDRRRTIITDGGSAGLDAAAACPAYTTAVTDMM